MKIYIVGGAVRDELLGKVPKDIDYLVTGATPEDMVALGYEQVGADFPVFLHPDTKDEYALARIERKTGNGYHGFAVDFDTNVTLEDDLSRRDLTINAMAKDPVTGEIIDPFDGRYHLESKTLKHVSPAFAEDPLRVIRLARFAARYFGFTIANSTMTLSREIVANGELNHLPNERFWAEMEKVMTEEVAGHFFSVLDQMDAFAHVHFFANLFDYHRVDFMWTGFVVQRIESVEDRLMFFTALRAKPEAKTIWSAPVRTQKLYTNIGRARNTKEANENTIYTTLLATRAWSQGSDFDDFVQAIELLEIMDEKLFISSKQLRELAEVTKTVTAADFPDLQGKALGDAIADSRKRYCRYWPLNPDQRQK